MQPEHRLRARADFETARRRGRSWGTPLLSVTAVRKASPVRRCGFIVSKRVGTAVVRNRVRRRLREIVRRRPPSLETGWDLVLIARPAAATAAYAALEHDVDELLRRAGLSGGING
jgi:ribonuclease P protein component